MALVRVAGMLPAMFVLLIGLGYLWGERRHWLLVAERDLAHGGGLGRVRQGLRRAAPARAFRLDGSLPRRHGVAARSEDPAGRIPRHGDRHHRRRAAGDQRLHHHRAAPAIHHHDGPGAGDRLPRRDLLRGEFRRLDHRDPGQFARRPFGLGHGVRRLSHGAARRGRARARHVGGGERHRRHLQRRGAHHRSRRSSRASLTRSARRSISRSRCSACRWWR